MATQVQMFDPVKYKATTREQWQNAAEAWSRWEPTLKTWLGPATVEMLDLADIGPGVDSEVRRVEALLGLDLPLVGLVDRPDQVPGWSARTARGAKPGWRIRQRCLAGTRALNWLVAGTLEGGWLDTQEGPIRSAAGGRSALAGRPGDPHGDRLLAFPGWVRRGRDAAEEANASVAAVARSVGQRREAPSSG